MSPAVEYADAESMYRIYESSAIDQDVADVHGHLGRGAYERSTRMRFGTDVKNAIMQLLAAQNDDLVTHLARVANLATSTAFCLGLRPAEIRLTRLAAELHDVGKVGIPAAIVEKSGALTDEEQWFMQRHSEIGERILAAIPTLNAVAPIVRAVHERPDGQGYPDGLRLEEIPVPSRIIAVADAFDAMTHGRPYQPAIPAECALAELRQHAGTQFDCSAIEAFATAAATEPGTPVQI